MSGIDSIESMGELVSINGQKTADFSIYHHIVLGSIALFVVRFTEE